MRAADLRGFGPVGTNGPKAQCPLAVMDAVKVQLERHLGARCMPELDEARAKVAELVAAARAYQDAQAMPVYGDSGDFVFPARKMRHEGQPEWGWICEKHGLGYSGGCICCTDDLQAHRKRKDEEARWARDDALRSAASAMNADLAAFSGVGS